MELKLVTTTLVASGRWGAVVWAIDASNKMPARKFFLGLDMKDRAKMQALFNRLAEFGHIRTRERFKKLVTLHEWALWEFKSFQIRFIGAFAPANRRTFLIAHGLRKKRDRHKRRDLERAVRILDPYSAAYSKLRRSHDGQ